MDRIDIKAALERRGWSLRRLSAHHGFAPGSLKKVNQEKRWRQGEWIVSEALDMKPWEVWPDRYPNGPEPRPARRMPRS